MRPGAALSILVLLAAAHAARAQDDAKDLVEKAIRAHGGETAVAKLKSVRVKVEGEVELSPGAPPVPIVFEDVWRLPDRYKTTSSLTLQGQKVTQTLCINGNEGWAAVNGQVQPLPPQGFKEMKEQKWAEDFDRLLPLRDKSLKLTRIMDSKVDDRPLAGIEVEAEGHRQVRLYFDKESGLLVKREQEVMGETGKLVAQSVVFSGFEDKGGVKHWTKITAYRDGQRYISATLRQLEIDRKNDATEFAKPDDEHRAAQSRWPAMLPTAPAVPVRGSRNHFTPATCRVRSQDKCPHRVNSPSPRLPKSLGFQASRYFATSPRVDYAVQGSDVSLSYKPLTWPDSDARSEVQKRRFRDRRAMNASLGRVRSTAQRGVESWRPLPRTR